MADLGYPASLASLGAVVGITAAIVTTGNDMRKISQVAGLTAVGAGLGMALDPDSSAAETCLGVVIDVLGIGLAMFGGNG
jgi:hypothetical protein